MCPLFGGSTIGGSTIGGSTIGGSTVGGSTIGGSTVGGSTIGGSTVCIFYMYTPNPVLSLLHFFCTSLKYAGDNLVRHSGDTNDFAKSQSTFTKL